MKKKYILLKPTFQHNMFNFKYQVFIDFCFHNVTQICATSDVFTAPVQSKSAVGTGRGPPQPQMVHTRADTSHSSLNTTTTSQKKGPKLQVPHSRHDMSTSSVETTGSKPRGPAMQQPHQRHDMSYSSVDSYPSVQSGGGMGYPPPARTSSRSSNQGPYPQYGGERNVHPARPLEGFSQPGYNQQGGQYPGYQQRRV